MTNFGLFIELEEGIDGLVHISDLSWTKKVKHPSEFTKVGEQLEIEVLEIDTAQRRLALGHKQLEENPWEAFADVFEEGSIHKCTLLHKTEKGAILELPYGIEGYCDARNLKKEDGAMPEAGDALDFKVMRFSKDDKKIALSHVFTYKEDKKAAAKKKTSTKEGGAAKVNQDNDVKSTLGDLDVLSKLKQDMEDKK
jgi:small subunit ribosomal protein S1